MDMVHEKRKSGDPDFDDKVPAGDHLTVVTAGDGKVIGRIDPSVGPVTLDGAHLSVTPPEEMDTRPAPGEVAKEKSPIQTYSAEDVPRKEVPLSSLDDRKPTASTESKPTPAPARGATTAAGRNK